MDFVVKEFFSSFVKLKQAGSRHDATDTFGQADGDNGLVGTQIT